MDKKMMLVDGSVVRVRLSGKSVVIEIGGVADRALVATASDASHLALLLSTAALEITDPRPASAVGDELPHDK